MAIEDISNVSLPNTPTEIAQNESVRIPVVKANAYITFALEEAGVNHDKDLTAAMVTDATHTLKENKTPEEYIELAIQELALAESEVSDESYQQDLSDVRRRLQNSI